MHSFCSNIKFKLDKPLLIIVEIEKVPVRQAQLGFPVGEKPDPETRNQIFPGFLVF